MSADSKLTVIGIITASVGVVGSIASYIIGAKWALATMAHFGVPAETRNLFEWAVALAITSGIAVGISKMLIGIGKK